MGEEEIYKLAYTKSIHNFNILNWLRKIKKSLDNERHRGQKNDANQKPQ